MLEILLDYFDCLQIKAESRAISEYAYEQRYVTERRRQTDQPLCRREERQEDRHLDSSEQILPHSALRRNWTG